MNITRVSILLLLLSSNVKATNFAKLKAFKTYGTIVKVVTSKEVSFLPRYSSQDSIGGCNGFMTWVLAQQFECKSKKLDCKNLSSKEEISPYFFGLKPPLKTTDENTKSGSVSNFETIWAENIDAALKDFITADKAQRDSCMPADQLANLYGLTSSKEQEGLERSMQSQYQKIVNKTEGDICYECLVEDVKKSYGVSITKEKIEEVSEWSSNFREFLYYTIMADCPDIYRYNNKDITYNEYPSNKDKKWNKEIAKNKIIELVKNDIPIGIGPICTTDVPLEKKCGNHAVPIVGYREVCTKSQCSKNELKQLVKIQNSWGAEWQEKNDDGWVDLDNLLNYVNPGATKPPTGSHLPMPVLVWLSPNKK